MFATETEQAHSPILIGIVVLCATSQRRSLAFFPVATSIAETGGNVISQKI